ncbi:unnamed protein product [Linum tenue]|uniref:Agmatine coumaroyltransferase-2-like n=2 Tax=Linum tenue TaxID=586396 RepID=A0AAV0N2G8_9ROSI|nr:unnamed protein product [Linum tenue]
MKVKVESTTTLKPTYESTTRSPPPSTQIPLSVFDKVTYATHIAVIYAYRPPTPSNSKIKLGLQKALAEYREWAGRLGHDENGNPVILLNDYGVKLVEASTDTRLDEVMPLKPSPLVLSLHPALNDVVELVQVQLTRFSCGSLVVGFTAHHLVADGHSTSNFLVAWGRASRGLDVGPRPFHDRTIFTPRNPPMFEYEHRGVEYYGHDHRSRCRTICNENDHDSLVDDIVIHKVHFTLDFLSRLKTRCATSNNKAYSTFVSLVAHLWRAVTKARGLGGFETTRIRISVDGRARMVNPRVPNEYFGNLVLWAFPTSRVKDLLREPLPYAAKLIHDAVAGVNDGYFKSFVDFASHRVDEEGLTPTAEMNKAVLSPDLEVDSWLRFPFYDLDFGGGCPYVFMPSFFPTEGMMFLLPSFIGDGSVDAFVPLFRDSLDTFKEVCYLLE